MSYLSIDTLQKSLAENVFVHTNDAKKAAGRALGTVVEIVTYYLLNEWGFGPNIAIETKLPEYGNKEITHNVEFTLHKLRGSYIVDLDMQLPVSVTKVLNQSSFKDSVSVKKSGMLLSRLNVLKNSCPLGYNDSSLFVANLMNGKVRLSELNLRASAMFECKRVGVEEGQKKGPQTIEKAKQGAYVAMKSSSLQKIRDDKGMLMGVYFDKNKPLIAPYEDLLSSLLKSDVDTDVVLTFGIVSNHGNWFTSKDMNKELKVLAQSFDRLLFLTDDGLSQFITETILTPTEDNFPIRDAFLSSYREGKKVNSFTKSNMLLEAHNALIGYFSKNIDKIEAWFNVISPDGMSMESIKTQLYTILYR